MKTSEPAFYAMIWIGGNVGTAIHACREFCANNPLCVTVTPTTYVYTGGLEDGVCVRLIQYPRFPAPIESIKATANKLAEHLCKALFQQSYSIEYPADIEWTSYRGPDNVDQK